MRDLEPPDTFILSATIGWLQLGNLPEAKTEFSKISSAAQNHPDVLEARWQICAEENHWVEGLEIARALVAAAPERSSSWLHQAYALRRVPNGGVKQAWDALLPAFDKFPHEPTISYNLSCYACQLDLLDAARVWFQRACVIGEARKIREMALADPDLQPLWEEIKAARSGSNQ